MPIKKKNTGKDSKPGQKKGNKTTFLSKSQNAVKYFIGLAVCLLIRLIPNRIPNVEPVMTTIMPFGKKFKAISSFIFGALSIVIYDIITRKVGAWTWVTAFMYGLVGLFAAAYLSKKANKARYYVGYSIIATLVYDAVTGIGTGVLLFGQGLVETILLQVPFTLWHLGSNIVLAALFSPLIYKWVLENPSLETSNVYQKFRSLVAS
ncbi:MAG: hypothetical protein QS98_C0007G0007 [archaeon GW2011_AR3]|nr:MAG: hypothetical protein QS98_C0007G0007 [archaeon GW2011_AR3]MBS3108918.1 hypothetical protein [Candidatus Woesearchaeota archaeon]